MVSVSVRQSLFKQLTTYPFTKRQYNKQLVDYIGQNIYVTNEGFVVSNMLTVSTLLYYKLK